MEKVDRAVFKKILIANRGEIAVRIIRACHELGIEVVAVYSDADRDSLHVQYADEAICIGPAPIGKSYLNIPSIISAALLKSVDAIHPGYGGLAEIPHFAEICEDYGLTFIGPSARAMELVGNKSMAKAVMKEAGVPVLPGSEGMVNDVKQACEIAVKVGYPVLLKASNGGGGKGIRVCENQAELKRNFSLAQAEAEASFGNSKLYIEKFIRNPRHIEIQILADSAGNVVHFGERDCSLQRRHQKLIEESPSPAVGPHLRRRMGKDAIKGVKASNYVNAGTVEFLLDDEGNYYFMEMNARIQVEHPVTEMITGIDLIKEQIRIAEGNRLSVRQEDIKIKGHSIECRICAEDPEKDFAPRPGRIEFFIPPGGPGIRVDTHIYPGFEISPYYDSMIAKVISWGNTRNEAINRMARALDEMVLTGVKTNIVFLKSVLQDRRFLEGDVHTNFAQSRLHLE
jgi:acetyl-CoA carboxylase biotin carboxylase subunit